MIARDTLQPKVLCVNRRKALRHFTHLLLMRSDSQPKLSIALVAPYLLALYWSFKLWRLQPNSVSSSWFWLSSCFSRSGGAWPSVALRRHTTVARLRLRTIVRWRVVCVRARHLPAPPFRRAATMDSRWRFASVRICDTPMSPPTTSRSPSPCDLPGITDSLLFINFWFSPPSPELPSMISSLPSDLRTRSEERGPVRYGALPNQWILK